MYQEKANTLNDRLAELEAALEATVQETEDLANIAAIITSIVNLESVLAAAMEISIRHVAGEVGAILMSEGEALTTKIAWGVENDFLDHLVFQDGLDVARYCLRSGKPLCENRCEDRFPANRPIRNFIACPIPGKDQAWGVVVILNKEAGRDFSDQDIRRLEMICRFTSVAIENARLLQESLAKKELEQELELARQVQMTFLPEKAVIPGLQIASTYVPARQVGGDYLDLIPVSNAGLYFLVGDVTSKGAPAALIMTAVYSIVRASVHSGSTMDPSAILLRLNDLLCRDIIKGREMFLTLFVGRLEIASGRLTYCNGGHPSPLFYSVGAGDVISLNGGGPLIGQFPEATYCSSELTFNPGDRIFCYTDGLTEAQDSHGRLFGLPRLTACFRDGVNQDPEALNHRLVQEIDRFRQGSGRDEIDDYTTLIIDYMEESASGHHYRYTYPSRLEVLETMYADLEVVFARHDIPAEAANPLRLAVSEAVTNAIIHAHRQEVAKRVILQLDVKQTAIVADIIDEGSGVDIEDIQAHDLSFEPLAESSRGLGLIRRLADAVEIRRMPQGGTGVKVTKYVDVSHSR